MRGVVFAFAFALLACGASTAPSGEAGGACRKTDDHLDVALAGAGHDQSCALVTANGETRIEHLQGSITNVASDSFALDLCPPNADCAPDSTVTISVRAVGLDVGAALRALGFVTVDVHFDLLPYACTQSIAVTALGSWGGVANPARIAEGALLLAGSDGDASVPGPLDVDHVPQGCLDGPKGATPPVDWYALRFTAHPSAQSVLVAMGDTATLPLDDASVVRLRNLRAYFEGSPQHFWEFAWWATTQPGTK